jgi:hypothetical protein
LAWKKKVQSEHKIDKKKNSFYVGDVIIINKCSKVGSLLEERYLVMFQFSDEKFGTATKIESKLKI